MRCLNALIILFVLMGCDRLELKSRSDADQLTILKVLKEKYPQASVVEHADIDVRNCPPDISKRSYPGIVKTDLNGDGKMDFAVLFQPDKGKTHSVTLERKEYELLQVKMAVLINSGDSEYSIVEISNDRIERTSRPFGFYLDTIGAGEMLTDVQTVEGKELPGMKLANSAVILDVCQQSSRIYYWEGNAIRCIQYSD